MNATVADVVLVEEAAAGVFVVTVNRPDRKNALNLEVKDKLTDALLALEAKAEARVIVLTGAEGCFVAGTDVGEMAHITPTEHTVLVTDRLFTVLRRMTKPVIASVEAYALGGGCELALSCDMIVAGRTAKFGLPEVRVGVMPGAGGTQRLLRTIGKYLTMRFAMTGDLIPAEDGYGMGFISELTDDGAALERSLELATSITKMPPLAIKAIKEVIQTGGDASLETAMLLERKAFQILFDSDDQTEGMTAFLEKRKPSFTGK
ncbi:enoyl-CoA hydratase-related protein [Celeribacter naphthalenivorans]|uniref:enoyl-CoA hydratase-related protein n=1 Tax=Celeribacter naphthalenivorans TaxID=1614694 RepID=UPI001CFA3187|nr:enoyl-CoA hydratase-related protein [Celeribacter naphthalenivorans]